MTRTAVRAKKPRRVRLKGRWGGRRMQRVISGYLFVLPNLLGFLSFSVFPIVAAIGLAFGDWDLASPPRLVGLGNFVHMTGDWLFWKTLFNTLNGVQLA